MHHLNIFKKVTLPHLNIFKGRGNEKGNEKVKRRNRKYVRYGSRSGSRNLLQTSIFENVPKLIWFFFLQEILQFVETVYVSCLLITSQLLFIFQCLITVLIQTLTLTVITLYATQPERKIKMNTAFIKESNTNDLKTLFFF